MLEARVCQACLLAALLEIHQCFARSRRNACSHPVIKTARPVQRLLAAHAHLQRAQVVYCVAASHNQHALASQALQLASDSKVIGYRARIVHAELQHRNLRRREHGFEHRPAAVVQPPIVAQAHAVAVRRGAEQTGNGLGGGGVAGRRVMLVEQSLRETAEIVDGAGVFICGDLPASGQPMRRHTRNQAGQGPAQPRAELRTQIRPTAVKFVVFDGVHRAAVT